MANSRSLKADPWWSQFPLQTVRLFLQHTSLQFGVLLWHPLVSHAPIQFFHQNSVVGFFPQIIEYTVYVLLSFSVSFLQLSCKSCSNTLLYSGKTLLRSTTGLGKSDLNGEVTLLQGVIYTVAYNLGLRQGDCNVEVFLLVG